MEVDDSNRKKDEPITESRSANRNLSINVHGVDICQSCIDGLLPQRMLIDNIVTMLIEYVMFTYSNYLPVSVPYF